VIGSLIGADVLKLAKRRGLMITSLVLLLGSVVAILVVRAILHSSDPFETTSIGAEFGYRMCEIAMISFGGLVSTAIGATAGAQDHTAGVFRDLVATGVSRARLFLVRIPAALGLVAVFVVPPFLIAVAAGLFLANGQAKPTAGDIRGDALYLSLLFATLTVLACALSTTIGSRGWVIGGLIAFEWVVQPLVASFSVFGDARQWLLGTAVDHFAREDLSRYDLTMSDGQAAITIILWMGAVIAIGTWRTMTRDA
jgi:ABC-type transport system involved in multi-copper enzyme maturation permease subunit